MSDPETLFDADALRVVNPWQEPPPPMTHGEQLRHRQAVRISLGYHPLAMNGMQIRLHADAPRDATRDDGGTYPRCGTCRFREMVGGHARSFPKCRIGYSVRDLTPAEVEAHKGTIYQHATRKVTEGPRVSFSDASDVRAWWPACTDYEERTPEDG